MTVTEQCLMYHDYDRGIQKPTQCLMYHDCMTVTEEFKNPLSF